MKVYLDYIFLVNFLFDFILLLGVSLVLKRSLKKTKLFLGCLFGGLSFFIIFFNLSTFMFFILKMVLALVMIIITFSYKDFSYTINNFLFLIILSILLGGFLYFIDIEIGYTNIGILFFTNGKKVNIFILLIFSFLFVLLYYKYMRKLKVKMGTHYKCSLIHNNKKIDLNGFLDTGNVLTYFNKPVVIINKNLINIDTDLFIPFTTTSGSGIMKGFTCKLLKIKDLGDFKNVVVALSNDKFHLEGADIILNNKLKEVKNENYNIFKKIIKKKK